MEKISPSVDLLKASSLALKLFLLLCYERFVQWGARLHGHHGTSPWHGKSAPEGKSYSHVSCVRIIAPRFSFSHQISLLLLLVDMYCTKTSIFVSKWDWIKKSRCVRHSSFPFSTLWLFVSFSVVIVNWGNLQPVLSFSSSLLYLAHNSLFLCQSQKNCFASSLPCALLISMI